MDELARRTTAADAAMGGDEGSCANLDVAGIWRMLDLITPMVLRVVATLRIADHIADGHDCIDAIAARAQVNADALARLLRYLTARGIFLETAPGSGRFALNDNARLLLDSHPSATRRWIDLEGFGGRMDLAFFDLAAAVRRERPSVIGDKEGFSPAVDSSYDDVMEAQSRMQAPHIVKAMDWTGVRTVADIGGGTGTQIAAMLRARPDVRGVLLDLPATAERAARALAAEGLADRCEVIGGDLFEVPLPRGADVYFLKFMLHFMADAQAIDLLRRCREAGHAESRVLVCELTVAAGDDRTHFTSMDLRMLILNEGRERTLEEYAALASRAGWRVASAAPTAAGPHLIELRRAE